MEDGTYFQLRRERVDETDPSSEIYIRRRIDRFPVYPDALVEFQVGDLALSSLGDAYAVTPIYQALEDEVPWGRWGKVEDVASAVSWLSCDDAEYITGQCIAMNGGQLPW